MFDFYFNTTFVLLACPNCVRSFGLTQKNQKVKAASAELLRHCVSLCAPQTRLRLRQRRSGRSTSFLRLTLTRTRPGPQLIIENWQWTISSIGIFNKQISWNSYLMNCQSSIVNCPLIWPTGEGVKRSPERSVKKSRLSEPKASFPRF